ncbi:DNA-binding SARP family transcriptional activator [Nonomuraea thailandensis]|uniref:DNA-binding SARP family transcriptional activator n=1 Tax=Nonomuraea thailandensis TaxID=1188745 RepID=A0A9X2GYV2_9ACTN|nr:AfsR/SARP family transcriptional regulator [Nonomuraea thailandensis]MCP2362893.1 DNA-binding SARP family transcriptional activator [Nonomuraea thailandensis]
MRFQVLGTLEIHDGTRRLTPSAPKQRSVLALLLSSANEVVPTQALIEELWEGRPPVSALTTLQTYVYQLRKLLTRSGDERGGLRLVTKHGAYLLHVDEGMLDAVEFERLVDVARRHLQADDLERASAALCGALDLWHGSALADVVSGPRLEIYKTRLEELRVHATKLRIDTSWRMGRHHETIAELKELTAVHPLDEWFHLRLMEGLSRESRRHEALEVYHNLRSILREELGLEPGSEMRELQQMVLATDHVPEPVRAGRNGRQPARNPVHGRAIAQKADCAL